MRHLAGIVLCLAVSPLAAQPAGPELRLNAQTVFDQAAPHVAGAAGGGFVVVWEGYDGSGPRGLFGRRFDASGSPLTGDFAVNSYTTDAQIRPSVAVSADGGFLVVWNGIDPEDGSWGVFARLFDAAGAPAGPDFRVNGYTTGEQGYPKVVPAPDGGFVVVWFGTGNGIAADVFARRLDAAGAPLGPAFRANDYSAYDQRFPSAGVDRDGALLIAWDGPGEGKTFGIWARRFASDGEPTGPSFPVHLSEGSLDVTPSVAALPHGGFVVAWYHGDTNLGDGTILGRRIDAAGTPEGASFRVNTTTTGYQRRPRAAGDAAGGFLVTWTSDGQDGSGRGVYAQRFAESGEPVGGELRLNTYTSGHQEAAHVASLGPDRYIVVWESPQDGSYRGIYGQRLWGPRGDADGNGLLNVSDVLYLINALFAGGPPPVGPGDADGNGLVNVSDVLYLINHLFAGGPAPPV